MGISGHDSRGIDPKYTSWMMSREILHSSNYGEASRAVIFVFILQYFTCGSSETAIFVEAFSY
jgi:hypothetical protein